jgi:hypothetical protein
VDPLDVTYFEAHGTGTKVFIFEQLQWVVYIFELNFFKY